MAGKSKFKSKSYEELEEELMERVHLYHTIQVAYERSNFHMSFMLTRNKASLMVDLMLSRMNVNKPGSLEQLVREQRKLESEFYKQVSSSSSSNKNLLLEKKFTQSIREAVDAKLDELGLPVIKPENYA